MRRALALVMTTVALAAPACRVQPGRVVVGIGLASNAHEAVALAAKEINSAGGIAGVRLELAGLDWKVDRFDPAAVLAWATRFAQTRDLVAVIGHSDSASTLSAAASYNRAGVPQIVTIATNPAITSIGPWTYRLCLSDAAQGPALADYAVTDWKKRRIAVFFVNDDYGRGLERRFETRIHELGAEVVATVMHRNILGPDDQETIRMALADMKQRTKPDLVVLFQRVPAAVWTLRAIHEAGLDVDKLGSDNLAQLWFIESEPELAEGVRVSQFIDPDPEDPRAAKFVRSFRAITGRDPDYGQAFAYDAVYLLRDALAQGRYTRAGVKAYLDRLISEKTPVHGVGGTFTLGPDHDPRRALHIAEIRNGHFHVIKSPAVT